MKFCTYCAHNNAGGSPSHPGANKQQREKERKWKCKTTIQVISNKRHILSPQHIPCPMSAVHYKKISYESFLKISHGCFKIRIVR